MQKKALLFFLIWLIGWQFASAQKMFLGPKAGVSISGVSYINDTTKNTYRSLPAVSYTFGAAFNFPVTPNISLHTEVNYAQQTKSIRQREDSFFYHKARYQFLEVPALFRLSFGGKHTQWYVNGGPALSYWLSGKGKAQIEEMDELAYMRQPYKVLFGERPPDDNDLNTMYMTDVRRLQINMAFGAGMRVALVNDQFILMDLRYQIGQTHPGTFESGDLGLEIFRDDMKFISHNLSASVTYMILLDFRQMAKGKSTIKAKPFKL